MSGTKHTKGPWVAIGPGVYQADEVGDREIVFAAHMARSGTREERLANARLIAAAPVMLEALRRILKSAICDLPPDIRTEASAAIAAATGQED